MSTIEEFIADEKRDAALMMAWDIGEADVCDDCGGTFYCDDLTEIFGKIICTDCLEKMDGEPEDEE